MRFWKPHHLLWQGARVPIHIKKAEDVKRLRAPEFASSDLHPVRQWVGWGVCSDGQCPPLWSQEQNKDAVVDEDSGLISAERQALATGLKLPTWWEDPVWVGSVQAEPMQSHELSNPIPWLLWRLTFLPTLFRHLTGAWSIMRSMWKINLCPKRQVGIHSKIQALSITPAHYNLSIINFLSFCLLPHLKLPWPNTVHSISSPPVWGHSEPRVALQGGILNWLSCEPIGVPFHPDPVSICILERSPEPALPVLPDDGQKWMS